MSDGAISFFLDHHVRTRVAKVSYGTDFAVPYNKSDPEHLKRPASKFINADGSHFISGVFNVVLPKVCLSLHHMLFLSNSDVRTRKFLKQKNSVAISFHTLPILIFETKNSL